MGKLPALTSSPGYAVLLENLILEALTLLAETKVTVKGVASQGSVTQKALTPAVAKYKDWASKNQDAAFVAAIAQSNEIRYSRLKTLKARDDAMQDVLFG